MIRIKASDGEVIINEHWIGGWCDVLTGPGYDEGLYQRRFDVPRSAVEKLRASKRKLRGKTLMERAQ